MARGGFNLRKWTSNSGKLLKLIICGTQLGTQITANTVDRDQGQVITEDDQSYTKSAVGTFATNSEDLTKILQEAAPPCLLVGEMVHKIGLIMQFRVESTKFGMVVVFNELNKFSYSPI